MSRSNLCLFTVGWLFLVFPAVRFERPWFYWMIVMGAGLAVTVAAVVRAGYEKPSTALVLLVVLNSSFWLCYLVNVLAAKFEVRQRFGIGGDEAVGFFLILTAVLFYELVVFIHGLRLLGITRVLSVVGLLSLIVHVFVTMRALALALEGI